MRYSIALFFKYLFVNENNIAMGSKFHFFQWKTYFSQFIFIYKYLKFKEFMMFSLKYVQPYFK